LKALSVRQPRPEQIMRGVKTMDVRTWYVAHRGLLAIHASAERRVNRVRELGFDPAELSYGAVVGVVDLVDIVPLSALDFEQAREQHLSDADYPGGPCYGWLFEQPGRLAEPEPLLGKMALVNVPDEIAVKAGREVADDGPAILADPARPFVLFTLPDDGGAYRVALYQWPFRDDDAKREGQRRIEDSRAPGALWRIELAGE